MNNSKKMTEIIEKKKELSQEKTPKYGTRKLSIGLVSCMLGFSLIIAPGSSKAAEASENETVATETKTPEENPIEEATPVANEEIKKEETKEEVVEQAQEVVAKQADTFVEKLEAIEVEEGEEIDYKQAVTNLPQDAKLDVVTPVDTKEAGEKTTSAKITFADGSVKEIQIKVNVKAVEAIEEAQDLEFSENVERQSAKAPKSPKTGVRDAAPPEDTTTDADANNAVHAYVGVVNGLNIDANLSKVSEQQFKPIAGVKAYFQWFETDGKKEYSSPVYTATSGADGQIHMGIKPYLAEDGKLIKFDADPTVSGGNERYRFWIDESTIPEGYQLQYITGESVIFPGAGLPITQGGSGSNTVRNIHGNWKILLMEKPLDQMHKEATPTEIQQDGGYLTGTVGWDYKSGVGGIQWNKVADIDTPAKDVTVKASYLSDYALKEIYSNSTAVKMGVAKPSDIRGNGWTAEQEKKLQDWIKEQVKKDPDKWIAETVSAKTNADGKYIIQFKGTWGNLKNKDAGLKTYNYKEGDASSGQVWNKWTKEQIDRLGKVADKADNGRFDFSKAATNQVKHVNYDWLFVSIEGSENLRVMTPYNNNQYTQMSNVFGINSGWSGDGFGVGVTNAVPQILRADFAVAPAEVKFNITNYDSGKNTAKVGDVAKTSTEGLPYYGESSENFRIVWYDEDGNKVQESLAQKPSSTGSLESADFDTSKVTKTTNYTAKLYRVDSAGKNAELLAQDSFTVVVEDSKKITSMYDEFEYKNPNPVKDATYSAKGLPEGLTIDPKTGDIKGVPKESGKFQVEVTTVVPDESGDITASRFYTYTVTDSPLADGNVGKEYNKKVEPKQIDGYVFKNVSAKFIDGKAIGDLTITGDQITGTPKAKVDATQEEPNVEVTYDIYQVNEKGEEVLIKKGHVDRVPLSIAEKADDTTKPEIGDLDDDDDPKTPVAPKEDENNKGPQVWANGARVTEGKEITPIKVNVKDDTDKNPTVEVTGLPKGLSYNAKTGKIEGTPEKLTNWADTEEERDFTATIKVKDAAGNEQTKEIQITILRDTDGDGIPDSTDPDDDNDGIKDEEDQNPKAWDAKVEGKVETTVGTQPTVDQYKEKITNLPKGSEVKVKTQPDVSKAGDTKAVVTVTLPNGEKVDVEVPVTVTDTTPVEKDADKYDVKYEDAKGKAGEKTTVKPKVTDKDGKATKVPEGTKYTLGKDAPKDATIDENTGEIKYTPTEADAGKPVEIPVVVTYPDKSTDNATAKINVAKLDDIIDRTGNEDKPTPKGYVRVTFTNGDGVNDIENNKVYDVKEGTVLPADKYPTVTAKDGFENPTWSTKPGTAITKDNAKIIATATKKKETSEKPVINNVTEGDKTISGKGVAGSDIVVTRGEDVIGETKVKDDGTWSVDVPAGETLAKDDEIVVTQTEKDKNPAEEKTTVKEKAPAAKPDAPSLKANDDGSVTVTPPADKDVDVVQITYTDEKDHEGTLVATKGDDGVWKLPDGTDPSIKIDPTTGVVTIPANQVKDGSEVKAIAQKGTEVSEVAKVNAKNNPVTKKEITKWVQETADGRTIELKTEDGAHPDNDGKSDIEGYEFVRTDKAEDDTTITYTNVYKLLLGSKAVGLDGKELKEATIGYDKENPEEFKGYTFLFDEAGNTPSDVEGKKVYVVNRIYAKNPEVVEVANPDSLTADEQNKVKEAVKTANPDLLDNQISVDNKGEVTITRGKQTAKLDPTLTVVKQGQTPAPKITQPKAGDTTVSGTAEPGATVKVTLPDGTVKETKADDQGNWSVDTPALEKDQTVKAVAQEDGKDQSDEATKTVAEADPTEATAKPEITAPKAGDTEIKGKAEPNAKVEVELPDGTKVETTADGEGNWTAKVPEGKEPKEGETVKAVATVDGKNPSEKATAKTGKADPTEATAKPKITAPKAGDTEIKGKAEPNAKVEVELPDGTKVETTADGEGNWTAKVPEGKEPKEGETVKAVATVDGKNPSEKATAKTGKADPTEATAKPKITAPKAGDKEIKGKAEPNAKVVVELPDGTKVETKADGEGNWTVKVPEGKEPKENDVVKAVATVDGKNPSEEATATTGKADEDGNKTIADKTDPNIPSKTEVKDKNNLTDEEKDKVKKAIEDANKDKFPQGTKVEIGKDGTATITYPDGSVDIIKGNDLVIQKAKAGASGSINRVNSSNTGKNVKTGVGSSATILATLAAAVSGLFASKKRKND